MWRRKGREPDPTRDTTGAAAVPARDEVDEQGLNEAHEALDRALSQWPEVTRIAAEMRGIRQRNHLADKVRDAMGGHRR